MKRPALIAPALLLTLLSSASTADLRVTSVVPRQNALTAPVSTGITIHFDTPVDRDTITAKSFWAFGRWSGTVSGEFSFSDEDRVVTLTPRRPFSAGETVTVLLSHDIRSSEGSPLRSAGFSFQFWTQVQPVSTKYKRIAAMTARTRPAQRVQAYGGTGSDLDGDGYLDLAIINEITADVRVFMNRADGSGLFRAFLTPPARVNKRASPNEPSDFNHDGNVDLCVANIDTTSVSILLGNGDGTFRDQQQIRVRPQPRGITVLDVDGDGDFDIVNTNFGGDNMSLLVNDGNGIFGDPIFFESGRGGEWSLASGDMNNDGVLDLVIGLHNAQRIVVALGNGDGTFSSISDARSGGQCWMLVLGDINGDGHLDVNSSNGLSNNATMLFGDGTGGLTPASAHRAQFTIATDLGDLDGDGDLDWVLSNINGAWDLFENDGKGQFTLFQKLRARNAASCALIMDIDNDGDMDLSLIDEVSDFIDVYRQDGSSLTPMLRGDSNANGTINELADAIYTLRFLFARAPAPPCLKTADLNDNGSINVTDAVDLLLHLFKGDDRSLNEPFSGCGIDPTSDSLSCTSYPPCE